MRRNTQNDFYRIYLTRVKLVSHICIAADVSIALMLLFCPQCSVLISDFGALGVWPLLSDTVREEGQKRSLETGGVSNEFGINP